MNRVLSRSWSQIGQVAVVATLLLPIHITHADTSTEADLKEEIVLRCHYQMGEFGVEAVRACIEAENSARKALSVYPQQARTSISRCAGHAHEDGWQKVKLCVDQDIEAAAALAKYPVEHTTVIELCRTEMREHGPAKIKACADERISPKPAAEKP